ncbi:MAG: hypothetical protein ABI670_10525 [Chloroflexota bacterium]
MNQSPPFNPRQLDVTASLNRVRVVDLPGVSIQEEAIRGNLAFDLLSTNALAALVREHAQSLGLAGENLTDPRQLPLLLDGCFESRIPAIREAAENIARLYGQRTGYLLLTLKRGDEVNRKARPEWNDTYWQHWAAIRHVWLGGGLVSGHLGPHAAGYANEVIADAGVHDCDVRVAAHPAELPLIGAARNAPTGTATMLVFDFGSSNTKSACAFYQHDTLTLLQVLAKQKGEWISAVEGLESQAVARNLAEYMVSAMVATWLDLKQTHNDLAPTVVATVASYMKNGQPDPLQAGAYGELRHIAPDVAGWFTGEVSRRLGQPISVELLHDGTAAANAYAGQNAEHTAVITLGTAIGVGFPPAEDDLRPMATRLTVK